MQSDTRNLSQKIVLAISVILLVGLGSGIFYYYNHKHSAPAKKYEKGLFNYDYVQLDNFSLKSSHPGSGMSFSKPIKYKFVKANETQSYVIFSHSEKFGNKFDFFGSVYAGSSYNPNADAKTFQDFYIKTLNNPQSMEYKNATNTMKNFVTGGFSPLYNVNFSEVKKFYSDNLKQAAWSMDVTASPKQKQPLNSPMENYAGKVVFAVGKQTSYFFFVYNTWYNWDNNSPIFDKTFQSIQIDQ